ncbi:MAG: HAMP domain-containing histidine kinase [Erysipelotrichaceae bacterium]|nr:HAMP domain-containing histidine kinase [Erysipelotrichaceae bacterium]
MERGISLKLDTHGIRFRFWLSFFLLAVGIIVFIGVLQTGLIRPYYRNSKVQTVRTLADSVQRDLVDSEITADGISNALKEVVDNNACIFIVNEGGRRIYDADSLGTSCVLSGNVPEEVTQLFDTAALETLLGSSREYSINVTNPSTSQEMIVFARKIQAELGNYYLYVSSPLEPVDSIVTFFTRQYVYYTLIAIIAASMVAIYISRTVTDPIIKMKNEAGKLARADYSADFDGGTFTETKELASTLNHANEKLSGIDELRRDLIANVSHDIRTPITDIKAYAEMIRDISGNDPEKRDKHLEVILKEADYMSNLVSDMSELSKMQTGTYIPRKENMDLSEKIYEVVDMNQPLIDDAGVKVEIDVPEYLTVYADELKIGQIITNYLTNAIKHSPKGKTIWIRAWQKEDEETVRMEVEDEGEGIAPEDLPNIWDRYQKSSHSFSRSQTSTGLGLAIVRAIAESHGAGYGCTSEPGKGSVFWLELKETHEG